MASVTSSSDFAGAFAALREILVRHGDGMIVLADKPTEYALATRALGPNKKPIWFGCVLSKKSAVTYHLLPLYYNPKLQSAVSPELAARQQGKTCFNFKRPDAALFAQLDALTKQGREQWQRHGFLEPGPIPPEKFAEALRAGGHDPDELSRERKSKTNAAIARRAATIRKNRRLAAGRSR